MEKIYVKNIEHLGDIVRVEAIAETDTAYIQRFVWNTVKAGDWIKTEKESIKEALDLVKSELAKVETTAVAPAPTPVVVAETEVETSERATRKDQFTLFLEDKARLEEINLKIAKTAKEVASATEGSPKRAAFEKKKNRLEKDWNNLQEKLLGRLGKSTVRARMKEEGIDFDLSDTTFESIWNDALAAASTGQPSEATTKVETTPTPTPAPAPAPSIPSGYTSIPDEDEAIELPFDIDEEPEQLTLTGMSLSAAKGMICTADSESFKGRTYGEIADESSYSLLRLFKRISVKAEKEAIIKLINESPDSVALLERAKRDGIDLVA